MTYSVCRGDLNRMDYMHLHLGGVKAFTLWKLTRYLKILNNPEVSFSLIVFLYYSTLGYSFNADVVEVCYLLNYQR